MLLPTSLQYHGAAMPDHHAFVSEFLGGNPVALTDDPATDAVAAFAEGLNLPDDLSVFGAMTDEVELFAERTLELERLTAGKPHDSQGTPSRR